jgi:hypothetical protein
LASASLRLSWRCDMDPVTCDQRDQIAIKARLPEGGHRRIRLAAGTYWNEWLLGQSVADELDGPEAADATNAPKREVLLAKLGESGPEDFRAEAGQLLRLRQPVVDQSHDLDDKYIDDRKRNPLCPRRS